MKGKEYMIKISSIIFHIHLNPQACEDQRERKKDRSSLGGYKMNEND